MHAGAGRVETLQPVDAEVAHPGARVAGMDERQGEEGAAVERPTGQARQFVQARRAEALLENGATANLAQAGLRQAPQRPAGGPQRGHGRRQQAFRQPHEFRANLPRRAPEGHLDALRRAEQVRHQAVRRALHPLKQQCRPLLGKDPVLDDRDLLVRIDLGGDPNELATRLQVADERA